MVKITTGFTYFLSPGDIYFSARKETKGAI